MHRAAEREWTERNATDCRTPCRKYLATPLARVSVQIVITDGRVPKMGDPRSRSRKNALPRKIC